MSPFVSVIRQHDFENSAGAALQGAGANLAKIGERLSAHRQRQRAEQARAAEANRRLDIAEENAKTSLLRESRMLSEAKAREDMRSAGREGSIREIEEVGGREVQRGARRGAQEGLEQAVNSSGGVLGPFGVMSRVAGSAAKGAMEAQRRVAESVELARRMSPPDARAELERVKARETQAVLEQGFQDDAKSLQEAVADGVIDDAKAKQYTKALQTALREKRNPGAIRERIAKEYDIHSKLVNRQDDWAKADKKAGALLDQLHQLVESAPDGVDPESGASIKQSMTERLAKAKGEWARTGYQTFRMKEDPATSLGGLQALIFGAQAEADPQGFVEEDAGSRIPPPSAGQKTAMGVNGPMRRGGSQAAQARPGAGQVAGGAVAQPAARPAPPGEREQLAAVVQDGARVALTAGSQKERRGRMKELLVQVADSLGLDPTDPSVIAVVREQLAAVHGGGAR